MLTGDNFQMKNFKVALTRTYVVSVNAESEEKAKLYSEYYLGDIQDHSTKKDRIENNFVIDDIEMVYNNATEIL